MQCVTSTNLKVTIYKLKKYCYIKLYGIVGVKNTLASKRKVDITMALMPLCTGSYT